MRAIRNIKRGEEFTICCSDPFTPQKERRIESLSRYGFICQCKVCRDTADKVARSDQKRTRLGAIQDNLQLGLMRKPFNNLILVSHQPGIEALSLQSVQIEEALELLATRRSARSAKRVHRISLSNLFPTWFPR